MENGPRKDVERRDIRNTSEEWADIIAIIDDPAMAFLIAEALSNQDLVKNNEEKSDENVAVEMSRGELIQYALERYLQLAGGVEKLFEKINQAQGSDLLMLKLEAIDLVIKRMQLEEVQYALMFLNSYRNFLPWELLKIKVKDVYEAMIALENTQQVKVLSKKIIEA